MLKRRYGAITKRWLAVVIAAAGAGCSWTAEPGGPSSNITNVTTYPDTVVLLVGDSARALSAGTRDSTPMSHAGQTWYNIGLKSIKAAWSSSNPSVVKVDSVGRATGVAAGEATITAAAGSGRGTTKIYVLRYQPALDFEELAPGMDATCGRTSDARVFCSTRAGFGEPPNGPPGEFGTTAQSDRCRTAWSQLYTTLYMYDRCSHIPLQVDGAHHFTAIAVSASLTVPPTACAIDDAGSVWCWGKSPAREAQMPALKAVAAFSSADNATYCGLSQAGSPLCWTIGNPPTVVDSTHQFTALTAYRGSACVLDAGGAAWCWGGNQGGVLGDSTTTDHASPAPTHTSVRFTSIVLGSTGPMSMRADLACALDASGRPYCWGGGQTTPSLADVNESLSSVAIAQGVACGVTQSGTITCWKPGGAGTFAGPAGTDWRRVFSGPYDMCGIAMSGRAACWVLNSTTNTWTVTDIPRGG